MGACLHCERCRSICPTGCVSVARFEDGVFNARTPVLDFTRGYCDFCGKCVEVCPTQSLCPFDSSTEKLGCAVLRRELCVNCAKCKGCCPYGALGWDDEAQIPVIDPVRCNGCGLCEYICPSASYGTAGNAHRRAIAVEKTL
ncbi:MAG: 4Fe-4S dicluster domain-containing protein [Coriobacteriales bacterium]